MQFYRRQTKSSVVPIVPMIDILFILLIFFIVTTNFKRPRHQLQITLPSAKDLATNQVVEEMTVLAIDAQGNLALEGAALPLDLLDSYLVEWRKLKPNGKLEIEADENAPYGKMLAIWSAFKRVGIEAMPTRTRAPNNP